MFKNGMKLCEIKVYHLNALIYPIGYNSNVDKLAIGISLYSFLLSFLVPS
jgi:hypothetical protein